MLHKYLYKNQLYKYYFYLHICVVFIHNEYNKINSRMRQLIFREEMTVEEDGSLRVLIDWILRSGSAGRIAHAPRTTSSSSS